MTRFHSLTKESANLNGYFDLNYFFGRSIVSLLEGIFETEVGELKYGYAAVACSESYQLNISWFPKNIEI